jgi:hypothetical protein
MALVGLLIELICIEKFGQATIWAYLLSTPTAPYTNDGGNE